MRIWCSTCGKMLPENTTWDSYHTFNVYVKCGCILSEYRAIYYCDDICREWWKYIKWFEGFGYVSLGNRIELIEFEIKNNEQCLIDGIDFIMSNNGVRLYTRSGIDKVKSEGYALCYCSLHNKYNEVVGLSIDHRHASDYK